MSPIDPALRIASVTLAVADLQRSVEFYERALGLPVVEREDGRARLGADPARPSLTLERIERPTPAPPGCTGLFHVAWLHPSRAALADTARRVAAAGWRFEGASDHGVSEALYLSDPDGLGIELYADRPRERWERPPGGHGVRMVTLPLDLADLLAQSPADPPPAVVAEGTGIGHVHLKVSDVERTAAFYRDGLGIEEQARIPSAAFLGAGGYHHHLGLNSWQSMGGSSPPASAPGLRQIDFELSDRTAFERLAHELEAQPQTTGEAVRENGHLLLRDPDGELLRFAHR
jgi:catechol 2,3-dioxygenase